ncbi:glycosyltransferase family 2 protein [Burkholderia sp. SIMBA_043]|uniref:glycosyltransferase n=1 Tax=Burkholderia TaxID=32008 RepID=UPI0005EEE114|nr:glycosyltransferase family 2 protein [Burkholderia vietnamiensis]AVR15346.1 glycosyl transferase [Burkholderia vietnamiensis]KVM42899.1 glycosyl transferase [Burkholderia vietnamiensis]KVS05429.1 glycosyl transferase [Burkholderia vietnamiensis]UBI26646.1 glycosyltransferase family 2 protein [Burkholderia vietnamiensis]
MDIGGRSASRERGLSVSIVVYRQNLIELAGTLSTLGVACDQLRAAFPQVKILWYLIDNGGLGSGLGPLEIAQAHSIECEVITGHGNVGYGRGHNLAVEQLATEAHLILNPDVDLDPDALTAGLNFLWSHPETGLLAARTGDEQGCPQYLCRRFPTLVDLAIRGFAPSALRRLFSRRLAHYEMRDVINDHDIVWDPPIVSGCFMLFRTEVLKKLGGFDPRYFLYFEDYDLSLRTHDVARVAYVPSVRVIHHGGGASRKGFAHIRMFAASAFKFYNRFGWRLW